MRQLWTWLRMMTVKGQYPVASSEAVYNAHLSEIDAAIPANGGKLRADGTWEQQGWKVNTPWPQSLPGIAAANGHKYMPSMTNDRDDILIVLDDPGLQMVAADSLVDLATAGRFDSPWDGVFLDLSGIPRLYASKLSDFLLLLSYKLRDAGLLVGISIFGRKGDTGPSYDDAYSYDYFVVGQAADYVHMACYGYWNPQPQSLGPYHWMRDCIAYAFSKGIPAQRLLLGLANYSILFPESTSRSKIELTYDQAIQAAQDANAHVEWIERNENGLVRERFADIGAGHVWIHDGDTHRHGLELASDNGLLGSVLFIPGMGDDYHWQVIEDWRA